jgi:hypothetical protein
LDLVWLRLLFIVVVDDDGDAFVGVIVINVV